MILFLCIYSHLLLTIYAYKYILFLLSFHLLIDYPHQLQ